LPTVFIREALNIIELETVLHSYDFSVSSFCSLWDWYSPNLWPARSFLTVCYFYCFYNETLENLSMKILCHMGNHAQEWTKQRSCGNSMTANIQSSNFDKALNTLV